MLFLVHSKARKFRIPFQYRKRLARTCPNAVTATFLIFIPNHETSATTSNITSVCNVQTRRFEATVTDATNSAVI